MLACLIPILEKYVVAFLFPYSYQVLALSLPGNYNRIGAKLLQSLRHSLVCRLASMVLSQRLNHHLRNLGNNSDHSRVWSYTLMTLPILVGGHLTAQIFLEKQVRGGF